MTTKIFLLLTLLSTSIFAINPTPVLTDNDGDGYFAETSDCDDNNSTIYPGAPEICGDGLDNNCDGYIAPCTDNDNDEYYAEENDCDDNNPNIYPYALDCNGQDLNCDGVVTEIYVNVYEDYDFDGYGGHSAYISECQISSFYTTISGDCDDNDYFTNPYATEICDGIDNNCNGIIDEGCNTDNDGDGYYAEDGDCEDNDPFINPGTPEICGDGIDNDCDGVIDVTTCTDNDGDGYFPEAVNFSDCNDYDYTINPGTTEICGDGIDNNCDGYIDDGCNTDNDGDGHYAEVDDCDDYDPYINPGATDCEGYDLNCDGVVTENYVTVYEDNDHDGFGSIAHYDVAECALGSLDVVFIDGDCDDYNVFVSPGATEICGDGIDNNCDGNIDEGCNTDADGDGYFAEVDDCDDNDPYINPGATDCDGLDLDCDGVVTTISGYLDDDNDGFGQTLIDIDECYVTSGFYVFIGGDCNDNNPYINPDATEICGDGIDNNCDGNIDEGCNTDNDSDGYFAEVDDCDDNNSTVYPGAPEICDGIDNDCDGNIEAETPMVITFVRQHVKCRGESTGSINISVSGGTAPFTYAWNKGAVTEDINGLYAGAYRVTVTSAIGCTRTKSIGIGQPGNIGLTATATLIGNNPVRYKVVATGSGGVAPEKYLYRMRPVGGTWTVWQSQRAFINRPVGTYELQIKTNGANCDLYKIITINVPTTDALMADAPDADLVIEDAAEMMEIAEMEDSPTKLEVFPNPTSETLNIRLLDDTDTESNIVIYDFLGRMVYQHAIMDNTNGNLMTVQLPSSLPSGTYLVVCPMADGTRVTQHFVLAKN